MRILVVDDLPTNRKLLRVMLEAEGHSIVEAADGVEALAVLEHEKIGGIISDVLMPRMDGYRLCREVRQRESLRSIPFIIYTSTYTPPSDEKTALELGADKFLKKPSPTKAIVQALQEAVEQVPRRNPAAPRPDELDLMKEFNSRLVAKLEKGNLELQAQAESLERSEAYLRAILASAPDGIVSFNHEGQILEFNPAAEKTFGLSRAEVLGKNMAEWLIPSAMRAHADPASGSMVLGKRMEIMAQRKDGTEFPVEMTITRIGKSEPPLFTGFLRNISERKRTEQQLLLQARALETAANAIVITDRSGTILWINPAFTVLTGYTSGDVIGKNPRLLKSGRHNQAFYKKLWATILAGKTWTGEFTNRRKDGTLYHDEHTITPVRSQGGAVTHFVAIMQDVTERKSAQEELRVAHEKLRHVLGHSPAVIYTLKIDGPNVTPVVVSDNIERLSGLTVEESTRYEWWLESLHPEDRDRVVATLAEAMQGNGYSMEYRIRHKDGTYHWIEDNNQVVRNAAGEPKEAVGVWTDITQRKRAEFDLAERTDLATLAADIAGAFTASRSFAETLKRCTNSMVSHLHAALARLWTFNERDQVLELQASSGLLADLDGPHSRVALGQFKVGLIAQERRPHSTNELRNDPNFSNPVWAQREGIVAFGGYPLIVQDELVGVVAIFARHPLADFSMRGLASVADQIAVGIRQMRAQQALRESEERYRDLFENAHDLIQSLSADGRFLYVNRAWRETLGYNDEELRTLRMLDLVHPDRRKECEELLGRIAAGELMKLAELEFVSKAGKRIAVEGSISAKLVDEKTVSLRCIFRDVTEKKKLEAQFLRTQRMESIGTLAGGIAHDLNNALAPIIMSIDLLKMQCSDPESAGILDIIRGSAERGAEMVKQVLTFSRGLDGQRVEVQLNHLVGEMQKIVKQTFPKNLQFRTSLARDLWTLIGDATQLHQVLLNLCVNARDAMPQGGTLSLKTENLFLDEAFTRMTEEAKVGPYVLLNVSDTGTGMPPDIRDRIFDPFFTTKPLGQGTGLGLSTVRGIVKAHGGFISVYSEVGKGSEFKVYLPAQASTSGGSLQLEARPLPAGKDELVLVVDDEASVRSIAQRTLEAFGYRVVSAVDGAHAVAVFAQQPNDIALVLIDVMMPIMDGPAAIRAIRTFDSQIKVIMASGLPVETNTAVADPSRPTAILTKPYTAEQLLTLVRQVLDQAAP